MTSFDEDTADALIEQLKPSMYAKGTEYSLKTLPERATLKKLDIKAVFVGDKKAHSSSKIIQRIRKRNPSFDDLVEGLVEQAVSVARSMEADQMMLARQLRLKVAVTRVDVVGEGELLAHHFVRPGGN